MNEPSEQATPSGPGGSSGWPVAFSLVVISAMLIGAGLYVFKSLRDAPGDAVDKSRELLQDLRSVAEAFRQGTIETRFTSYATSVSGSSFLQFATLHQTEVYTRTDEASVLWGQLELPEVVVSATVPVEYTYYLDLEERWNFRIEGRTLTVETPEIRFNRPAIDVSGMRYEVRQASLLRDEEQAIEQLQKGLTRLSLARAREHIQLVREVGRRETEEFVASWLARSFGDGEDYILRVVFPDERPDLRLEENG